MKKISFKRSLALFIIISIIGTMIQTPLLAYAADPDSDVIEVIGFAPLEESVKVQRVPLGISAVDLNLPGELTSSVYSVAEDIAPVIPPEQFDPTDTPPVQPEQVSPGVEGGEPSLLTENPDVSLAATPPEIEQPKTEILTIHDITWKSEIDYNENESGTYIFTAVLPKQYAPAAGVAMPEIAVTVYDSTKAVRSWTWNDPKGYLTEGILALPGVNAENPVDLAALVAMLPESLNATIDTSDASTVQNSGEAENTPVSVALQWSSTDFVQSEDKTFPIQGEFTFVATMEDGYTLAEDAPPLKITVQLGGAMLLPSTGVFTKLEIREGRADGNLIVNLLDSTSINSDWKLEVDKDYYLCAELPQSSDITHIQLRYGNVSGAKGTANGVTFANPPGATYAEGAIQHDYLGKLSKREDFPEIFYGSPSKQFGFKDGIIEYEIKNDLSPTATVSLAMGLMVKDELFVSGDIENALSISAGKQVDGAFIAVADPTASHSVKLKMADKVTVVNEFSSKTATAEIDSVGSTLTYRPVTTHTGLSVAILYDKLEFDVTYPKDTTLSVGFNQSATTTVNQYQGVIKIGPAKQDPSNPDMLVSHVTIGPGLKEKNYLEPIYMKLTFSDNDRFAPGQEHTVTVSPTIITVGKNNFQSIPGANDGNIVTYTLLEKNADRTTLAGTERTVYNNTIDMGVGARYHIPLGTAVLKNESASSASPYAKTFEAQYNIGNTAANISRIIVPIGDIADPQITWEGITSDGSAKSGTVAKPSKYLDGKDLAKSAYFLLPAEEFGIISFTSVKAEIGKLRASYNSNSNTAYATYRYHICGAFGYFTTDEPGLVVRNTFRIYNTDVALQSRPNGDISAEGVAISTDWCGMAVGKFDEIKLNDIKFGPASSVSGGDPATIKGELLPYDLPTAAFHPDDPTRKGTTAFVTDPIIYITLPQGLTLVSDDLKFQQKSTNYLSADEKTVALNHTIENVSYLNTTGDGVSIYKITFPDNTTWGCYDGDNRRVILTYEIKLLTSKSLVTQRYRLNDLVSVTTKNGISAIMRQGLNNGYITFVKEDKYGLNDGKPMAGVATDTAENPLGFAVQQQAEINVYNAVAVTKIDNQTVPERWYSYDPFDPNSIAMLGRNSEGRLRLRVSNTSDAPGEDFAMVLPLPKQGLELGDVFMEKKPEFTLSMEYDGFSSNASFSAQYIKLDGINDTIPLTGVDKLSYKEVPATEANAVLLTTASVPKGDFDLYLNFKLSDGTPAAMNIWRPAYSYTVSTNLRSGYGSCVASAVAGSGITGVVWNDGNRNGQKDARESGVADVTVVAKDDQNRILSTKTAADGSYTFLAVRESQIEMSFITDNDKNLRFNIQPLAESTTKTVSTVLPEASGLRATKNFNATGNPKVNAAMSGFITLKYDANTGTGNLPKTAEYVSGAVATVAVKPDNLTKIGYRFVGWNTKADGNGTSYQPGNTLTITENATLYAIWELGSYTITFNYRGATGGNTEGSRVRQHGVKYGALPTPTKVGYDFKGWMDSSAGTTANVTAETEFITGKDTTVYALWTPKVGFIVKYNTNGGSTITDKHVTWTGQVSPSGKPTRTGYDFVEWRHKGTAVLAADTFGDLSDSDAGGASITLDAVWKAKTGYKVNYDTNGGDSAPITAKAVTWMDKNLLPSANPTKTGNAFAGWKLDTTEVTNTHSYADLAKTDSTKSITLKAQWVTITGNVVSYDTDGGTPVNDKINVADDATGLLPNHAPAKYGYTLEKWVVSSDVSGKIATASSKYNDLSTTNTLTLKAVWSEKNYTIAYLPNNGKTITDKTKVKWGNSNLLPTAQTKEGYTLAGWYFGDVKVDAATKVQTLIPNDDAPSNKLTLTAHWTERTYLVEYNSAGGGNFTPKSGVKYTATGLLPDTAPVKEGYTFNGWLVGTKPVKADTTCGSLLAKETDKGVTLLAKWTAKTGFTVKYNTAGGTEVPDKSPVSWTDTGLLPTTPPTRTGYDFRGWTEGRTMVTSTTAYSSIAESDQAGTSVTLVAGWREKSGFTVKYSTGDGGTPINAATVSWGGTVSPSTIPTRADYIFGGWKHGDTSITAASKYSELAVKDTVKEITLIAVWIKKDNYKVTYNTDGGTTVPEKTGVKWTDSGLLPSDNPTKSGYTFAKWQYGTTDVSSTDTYGALALSDTVAEIVLKAVWTKDPDAGPDISGVVKDEGGNLMENAEVRLTQGSETKYGPTKTNAKGEYLLSNLKSGIYNLVAEKDGQTVTVIVTIASDTVKQDLELPAKKKNSVLEVTGKDTPPVVVGNLDEIAKNTPLEGTSTSLTIKLAVKKEAEQASGKETEHREIRNAAGTNATILYLDALLTKQVDGGTPTDIGNLNNTVLEVVIPFDLAGKKNVRVYRHHGGVNAFKQLSNKPTGIFVDETCYLDVSAGLIHVYAKKYSTYAISYRTGGGDNPGGGGNNPGGGGNNPGGGDNPGGGGHNHRHYEIKLNAGTGGHIEPNESKVIVCEGNSAGFDFVPDSGYRITEVKVDGRSIGAVSTYMFRNVYSDHTLSVSFEKIPVTPEKPSTGGSFTPEQSKPPVLKPDAPNQGDTASTPQDTTIKGDGGKPTTPELPIDDSFETIKKDVIDDLSAERDKAIAALPQDLTAEQRQDAVDVINQIYDETAKKIEGTGSAAETSELFNQAKREIERILEAPEKALSTQSVKGGKPFILLSALLALFGVICAVLTLRRKRSKKTRVIAIVAAIAEVIVFFLTTGWHGIVLANVWTILIAVLTVIPAWLMFRKTDEDDSQEEQPEAVQ